MINDETYYETSVNEFVKHLRRSLYDDGSEFVLFIGAGCSITSGIPGAAELVEKWKAGLSEDERKNIIGYDSQSNSELYSDVIKTRFRDEDKRQEEFDKICKTAKVELGYIYLAILIEHLIEINYNKKINGIINKVITTNFDDLLLDAFAMYTSLRPLVINHRSLSCYVSARSSNKSVTVFKIHGDYKYYPLNTKSELKELPKDSREALRKLIEDRELIFIGYSGNDYGLTNALNEINYKKRIYWVNDSKPGKAIESFLKNNKYTWVQHKDFDQFMFLVFEIFELDRPDEKTFNRVKERFREALLKLSKSMIECDPESSKKCIRIADKYGLCFDQDSINELDAKEAHYNLRKMASLQSSNNFIIDEFIKRIKIVKENNLPSLSELCRFYVTAISLKPDSFLLNEEYISFLFKLELNNYQNELKTYQNELENYLVALRRHSSQGSRWDSSEWARLNLACRSLVEREIDSQNDRFINYYMPIWAPNESDDVVLSMHPSAKKIWKSVLPNGDNLNLHEVSIGTQGGNWHLQESSIANAWRVAYTNIINSLKLLISYEYKRLHLFVSGPFSLGAFLGNKIYDLLGRSKELLCYQYNSKNKQWENWGPSCQRLNDNNEEREERFLESTDVSLEGAYNIVILFNITRKLDDGEVKNVLDFEMITDRAWCNVFPKNGPGQDAIKVPSDIRLCVRDISELISHYSDSKVHLHVFFSCPLSILIMASSKFHLISGKMTIYERVNISGVYKFVPAIEFPSGELVIDRR